MITIVQMWWPAPVKNGLPSQPATSPSWTDAPCSRQIWNQMWPQKRLSYKKSRQSEPSAKSQSFSDLLKTSAKSQMKVSILKKSIWNHKKGQVRRHLWVCVGKRVRFPQKAAYRSTSPDTKEMSELTGNRPFTRLQRRVRGNKRIRIREVV